MKKAFSQLLAALVIGLFSIAQLAAQGVVGTLSIQGTLKRNNGQSVDDGTYALTFKIYTVETGGTALWSETQPDVSIVGGVYSVALGTVSPLTPNFDVPYWLGVTVGTGAELQPRTALTAAPYALALLGTAPAYFGDVKTSYQTADHAGWVRLDGRAKTTLSATQQSRATALGIGANLPSDDGRVLAGTSSGQTVGQMTGGGSTITIAQNNLPNVNLTTNNDGSHTHSVSTTMTANGTPNIAVGGGYMASGNNVGAFTIVTLGANGTASASGSNHTHTIPLNGGVTQQPITVPPPAAIALNFFMYLGI